MDPSKDESHVDNASKQETTTQPKAESTLFAANSAPIMSTDVTSLMKQLVSLQQQNNKLESLVNTRDKLLSEKEEYIKSLTEKKRIEMQNELKNGIDTWLQAMDLKNPESRLQFRQGLENLADRTKESGVWDVVCCASAMHRNNVNELARLQSENSALRTHLGANAYTFQAPHSRIESNVLPPDSQTVLGKRGADEPLQQPETITNNYWDDFEKAVTNQTYNLTPEQLRGI